MQTTKASSKDTTRLPHSKAFLSDPDAKRGYNKTLFAIVAPKYRYITRLLSFGRDEAWKRELVTMIAAPANACIGDIACGTGDIAQTLAKRFPEGRVIGMDLTFQMIRGAKTAPVDANLHLALADMNAIPMSEGCFDVITGGYALRNSPDLAATFSEVSRTLKHGGQAVFLDFTKSRNALMSNFQIFLLKFWGGLWGLFFHGNPAVYAYIGDSLAAFPDRQRLHAMCQDAGITVVRSRLLFFGFIEIILCRKADKC